MTWLKNSVWFSKPTCRIIRTAVHLLIILEMLQLVIQAGLTFIVLWDCMLVSKMYWQMPLSLLQLGIIVWGPITNLHKALIMQKRIIRVMLRLRQRTSCKEKLKKLQILSIPSLYIPEMMVFFIINLDKYQSNISIHTKDTKQRNHLHLQTVRVFPVRKCVCCSSVRYLVNFPHTLYNYVKIQWPSRTL